MKTETLANLSHLPPEAIEAVRASLAGETLVGAREAVRGRAVLASRPRRRRVGDGPQARPGPPARPGLRRAGPGPGAGGGPGVPAGLQAGHDALVGLRPRSGRTWAWRGRRPTTSTAPWTGWLPARPTSKPPWPAATWPQGAGCSTTCRAAGWRAPIARWPRRGYSRDGKAAKAQVEYGLTCDPEGRPVAVEVFAGNTADPTRVHLRRPSGAGTLRARRRGDGGRPGDDHLGPHRGAAEPSAGWAGSPACGRPPSPPWPLRGRCR